MRGLRLGGHPLHPALVHFPVACWTATPVLYAVYLLGRDLAFWRYAWWCNGIGIAMALVAMTAGFMDLMAIPPGLAQDTAAPYAPDGHCLVPLHRGAGDLLHREHA